MMELENGMVSGAMPYNQSDAPARSIKCPALTGRHLRARKGREPVSKWPNARLVIVGKEWVESEHEWEEMNHEIV